ncbi:unnamed protein product [Linum trigynum]|uniref:Uncharacterized protein n=1 Tax=Linum trigynum TaxID=586398 RepID=A0AAV2GXC5_9ROSI
MRSETRGGQVLKLGRKTGVEGGEEGSQLSVKVWIRDPFPTCHLNPRLRRSLPVRMPCHAHEGREPTVASKNARWG